jgi:hypothetical protein
MEGGHKKWDTCNMEQEAKNIASFDELQHLWQ